MGDVEEHHHRLDRARLALRSLAVGDALGGFFEFAGSTARRRIAERRIPGGPWRWTDDTQMAGAVLAALRRSAGIDQDVLAAELAARYERGRGYGMASRAVLSRLRRGGNWRVETPGLFGETGSFGNGAASRVPPIGAYFADDLAAAADHAARSAVVTHAHPEAVAGAIAVAVAAALSWQLREQPTGRAELLERVVELVPPSAVRDGLAVARNLPPETTAEAAAEQLGSGSAVSCQDTVPFAVWCAAGPHTSFEEAIWFTLAGLGDCDTTCAIVGGIVALRTDIEDIPERWCQSCEPPPDSTDTPENPQPPGP